MNKSTMSTAFFVIIIDQIIKFTIVSNFKLYGSMEIIKNFFSLTYIKNTGAAWGLFQDNQILFAILGLLASIFIYLILVNGSKLNNLEEVSYGLLIGGIIGNAIDRVLRAGVIDYLDFNIFGYNFPIFNLADICIIVGLLLIILSIFGNGGKHATVKY